MYKLTTVLLMMCLSCQLVLKLSIIAWFEINQDYIAATFCENRNKPELVCCGKCVLTRQLSKVEKTEQKDSKNTQTRAEKIAAVQFIIPENTIQQHSFSEISKSVQHAVLPHHFDINNPQRTFHPPTIFCS